MAAGVATMVGMGMADRAIAEPAPHHGLDARLRGKIPPGLPDRPGLGLNDCRARLPQRFANPELQHATQPIAMGGAQKQPQRRLGAVRGRRAVHGPLSAERPARLAHAQAAGSVRDAAAHFVGFAPVLGAPRRCIGDVARPAVSLPQRGVVATLQGPARARRAVPRARTEARSTQLAW